MDLASLINMLYWESRCRAWSQTCWPSEVDTFDMGGDERMLPLDEFGRPYAWVRYTREADGRLTIEFLPDTFMYDQFYRGRRFEFMG